ncbi:MAG: tetratricopeptide repeat protein [Desulfobacterales bacterium]
MKKLYICLLALLMTGLWLKQAAQAYTFEGSAAKYFYMGMKTSLAYKKIHYFTKALELNPRFAPAYEERGLNYYFQEKYDKVIQDFTHYIHLVPNKAGAYRMLGMGYLKIGNYPKAIINFDKALDLKPQTADVFSYRAEAFRLNGQLDKAIKDATKAIALESDQRILSDAYRTRGKAYEALGQQAAANADFNKATKIDPRYFFFRYVSGYGNLEDMRRAGLIGMIGIAFVYIFGMKLRPPGKDK